MADKVRVLIVDDHVVFAQALHAVLRFEPDLEVVGLVNDGVRAVAEAERTGTDVVLMDYKLPGQNGARAAQAIKGRLPTVQIVMLPSFADREVLLECLQAGVSGFLSKEKAVEDVIDAVRLAHAGELRMPSALLHTLLAQLQGHHPPPSLLAQPLTLREQEVLLLMAEGQDNQAIAERLQISGHTARTHVQNILGKLDCHSRLEAVTSAVRAGLIQLAP